MTTVPRRSFAIPVGCLFVGLGVVLGGTLLEATIFPAGTIVGTTRREAALGLGRLTLAGLGAYLLFKRPRVTSVHLCTFSLVAGLSLLVGAMLLQVGYVPPPVVSGWKSLAPKDQQNQLGFRGRRIAYSPEDYVVLLVGDSQVEAMALPSDAMPERRLEAHLDALMGRVRVFSLGAGGYGQDQELLALQEYFQRYRADLVLLWQTPGNDVWNNVFKTHMFNRNPKPTYWLDRSGTLRGPSESLLQPLAESRVVVSSLWMRAFGLPWRDKSWERQLPNAYVPLSQPASAPRTDWQDRWNSNLGRMRDESLDTEKSHLAIMLTPRSDRMQYGLDLTHALMQRIDDLVTRNDGKLVVFYVDDPEFVPANDEVHVLNGKYYRVSKRQFEANWNHMNRGFDVEAIPLTERDWRVGPEDGHLNTRATEQVMRDLVRRLRSRISEQHPATMTTQ